MRKRSGRTDVRRTTLTTPITSKPVRTNAPTSSPARKVVTSEIGGIRLEDDVLVGADGPVLLSHLPLELRVLS
jgi:Xaa-Pro aminopeptidase